MNIQELQEEIQDIKISIGVEKKQIEQQKLKLKKYGIQKTEDAKQALKAVAQEMKRLEDEAYKLGKKAKNFLSLIDIED
jgi:hypothetical protein